MVRSSLFCWTLAVLAVLGNRAAPAGQIGFTGNVEKDFPMGVDKVGITVDNPKPIPPGYVGFPTSNPMDVAQSSWMTDRGWTTGWNIKDIRMHYDQATDSLAVGVNFFGIAGDADGNGNPGTSDAATVNAGGIDLPNLGGRESISVAFDLNNDRKYDIIAGVPADKTQAGPGIDGFTVSSYRDSNQGLAFNYGTRLANYDGGLAFDPSSTHPGFEFLIKNFSKLPGVEWPKNGFGFRAFAGTPDDVIAGEDSIPYTAVSPERIIPEPTTVLAWSLMLGGAAAWRYRRRRSIQS